MIVMLTLRKIYTYHRIKEMTKTKSIRGSFIFTFTPSAAHIFYANKC